MKLSNFDITAFISGACIMVLEILGSRIVAPYIGTSLYVWTSLIGVIMFALAIGYYFGGRIADKHRNVDHLSAIFLISALFVIAIPLLSPFMMDFGMKLDPKLGSIVAALVLFFMPAALMGMVSPYIIRLTTERVEAVGSSSGKIFAISTAGSILGTFLAGFILIPLFGTKAIIYGIGVVLFLLAVSLKSGSKNSMKVQFAIFAVFFIISASLSYSGFLKYPENGDIIYATETPYYLLSVREFSDARVLFMDRYPQAAIKAVGNGNSSEANSSSSGALFYLHTEFISLIPFMSPNATDYLTVGAGACTEQTYLLKNTNYSVDSVELDPTTFEVCHAYFGYPDTKRTTHIISDGRAYLNDASGKKYDVIRTDVFTSGCQTPFHLSTLEYVKAVKNRLTPRGISWLTVPGTLDGEGSEFIKSQFAVYKSVFKNIYIFLESKDKNAKQSIGVFATDLDLNISSILDNPKVNKFAEYYYIPKESDFGKVLTDDYAPVEAMLDRMCT
ncbi:TPA: hypothetical protein HA238_02100 [Candidatus Micrarchaeota archaeon]|nr:hypothetical protein [Candidatus Micrarchaeota archaeon]